MAGPLFRILLWAFLLCSGAVFAQDKDQSLADIRQDLGVLYIEIQKLKRELSTTQLPSGLQSGDSVLERVNAIELELQRLTGATEQLDHRLKRVVEDGTNRIGDLEFRLIELEGGDISNLANTTTLGGDAELREQTVPIEAPLNWLSEKRQILILHKAHLTQKTILKLPKCSTVSARPIPIAR